MRIYDYRNFSLQTHPIRLCVSVQHSRRCSCPPVSNAVHNKLKISILCLLCYSVPFHRTTAHSTCQCQTQSAPSHASTHATHDRHMTSLALANYGIKSFVLTDQRHHDVLICRFIIIIICYLLI